MADFVGVIDIDYKVNGWTEKFYLRGVTSYATGLTKLRTLIFGRSALFGKGVECTYARVSRVDSDKDALVCNLPYPIGPHPSLSSSPSSPPRDALDFPQEAQSAVQQREETANGKWANRYIRGIPDAWITNKRVVFPELFQPFGTAVPDNGIPYDATQPHLDICQQFWRYLMDNVSIGHVNPVTKVVTYSNIDFLATIGVTSRKTGRPSRASHGRRPANLIR